MALVERAAGELSGADQRRWLDRLELEHDDIRAVLDRAVAAPDPPVAIGLAFSMWRFWQKHGHLAEARRRLEAMAAAPLVARRPAAARQLLEALGGTCWWQGDLPAMTPRYEEALEIWQTLGDEAELANAYYNASFTYAVTPSRRAGATTPTRTRSACATSSRRATSSAGSATGGARAMPSGASATTSTSGDARATASTQFRETLTIFREVGDRTMEAWALHMLGTALLRNGHGRRGAGPHRPRASATSTRPATPSGLTLTFDDMSAVAVADGDLPRAARLRGAARNLTVETGAQLAGYVEDTFETGVRPGVRTADVVGGPRPIRRGGRGLDARRGDRVRPRGRPIRSTSDAVHEA